MGKRFAVGPQPFLALSSLSPAVLGLRRLQAPSHIINHNALGLECGLRSVSKEKSDMRTQSKESIDDDSGLSKLQSNAERLIVRRLMPN